jgi:hypothetical protein
MGYETGVDLSLVVAASRVLYAAIARRPVSRVYQAVESARLPRAV